MKHGPWLRCHHCGHLPTELVDRAKHEMTSDHCLSHLELQTVAAQIQSGHPRHFNPKELDKFVSALRTTRLDSQTKEKLIAKLAVGTLIALVGAGVFWFFHWLTR